MEFYFNEKGNTSEVSEIDFKRLLTHQDTLYSALGGLVTIASDTGYDESIFTVVINNGIVIKFDAEFSSENFTFELSIDSEESYELFKQVFVIKGFCTSAGLAAFNINNDGDVDLLFKILRQYMINEQSINTTKPGYEFIRKYYMECIERNWSTY